MSACLFFSLNPGGSKKGDPEGRNSATFIFLFLVNECFRGWMNTPQMNPWFCLRGQLRETYFYVIHDMSQDIFLFNFSFFFFLQLHMQHMEVPGPGVRSELQLQPTPQPQQCQIWAASVTYATACGNAGSLTHWTRTGTELASPQTLRWVLNLLSHNGNSLGQYTLRCSIIYFSTLFLTVYYTDQYIEGRQ